MKHDNNDTKQTNAHWVKRFILLLSKCHMHELDAVEVKQFLMPFVVQIKNRSFDAKAGEERTLILSREVLAMQLPWLDNEE